VIGSGQLEVLFLLTRSKNLSNDRELTLNHPRNSDERFNYVLLNGTGAPHPAKKNYNAISRVFHPIEKE
jgi:hypothetical protein